MINQIVRNCLSGGILKTPARLQQLSGVSRGDRAPLKKTSCMLLLISWHTVRLALAAVRHHHRKGRRKVEGRGGVIHW